MSNWFFSLRARLIAGQIVAVVMLVGIGFFLSEFIQSERVTLERLRLEQQGFFTLNRVAGDFTAYQAAALSKNSTDEQVAAAWAHYEARVKAYGEIKPGTSRQIHVQAELYAVRAANLRRILRAGASTVEIQAATAEARAEVIALGRILTEAFDQQDQAYKQLLAAGIAQQDLWSKGFYLCVAIAAVFVLLYIWFVLRSLLRPLSATVEGIRAVQAGRAPPELPRRGEFAAVAGVLEELRRTSARVQELAYADKLTGLGSRARFEQLLESATCKAEPFVLVLVDLHQLTLITSVHGPRLANLWLASAARRLQGLLEHPELLCRFGDARFSFLLPGVANGAAALAQLHPLMTDLQRTLPVEHLQLRLEAKIGAACFPADAGNAAELLTAAKTALVAVQRSAHQDIAVHDKALAQSFREDLELAQDIERGLERQEFVPRYEPIVDVQAGRVLGFETLARWAHPQRGLLPPGAFVPLAEASGRIAGIDAQILPQAMNDFRGWLTQQPELRLGINLSARELNAATLEHIANCMRTNGLRGEQLVAEITETSILQAGPELDATFAELPRMGIAISLDDFGTGYSSLSHLARLPISSLKLDLSFVREIGRSPVAERIIETLLHLGRQLSINVVAEGVETPQQLQWLLERGCYRQQGYLFTQSLMADAVPAWLQQAPQRLQQLRDGAGAAHQH